MMACGTPVKNKVKGLKSKLQKLRVGITKTGFGLQRVLEQEGIPFNKCSFGKKVDSREFACVIVNSCLSKKEKENAKKFVEDGGTLILSLPASLCSKSPGFDMRVRKLAFDVDEKMLDCSFEKLGFVAKKAFPSEIGPSVNKQLVRIEVAKAIRELFELRNLPFLHLWYYPQRFKSVFCFHVDVDNLSEDVLKSADILRKLGVKASWFVSVKELVSSNDFELVKQVVSFPRLSQHGFFHRKASEDNSAYYNVIKADAELKKLGVTAKAFSAPNGIWSNGIAQAVEDLNYEFAIAFSLDFDNLPFNPIVKGKQSKVLFLPIHPVCIGLLKMHDFSEEDMVGYFLDIIERNKSMFLPILLYGHPFKRIARFPRVLERIMARVRNDGEIWEASHGEFVEWWKERQKTKFKAFFDGSKIKTVCKENKEAAISCVFGCKRHFLDAKSQCLGLEKIKNGETVLDKSPAFTSKKASPLGKKHLLKKYAGKAASLAQKALR